MTQSAQELAREVARLRRKVEGRTPQLIHSTVEGGAIPVRSSTGQLTALVGQQWDGTYGAVTVAGPTPPQPSVPTVEVIPGVGLRITWDGTFADGPSTVAPMDWGRCEVSISSDSAFSGLLMGRFDTSIESPRGGAVDRMVDYDVDFYVRLVARSSAGKPSAPSPVAGPFRVSKLTAQDLDLNLDGLRGTKIHYGAEEPVDASGGDLWLKTVNPGPPEEHETWRLVDGVWGKILNQEASAALAAAIAARNAADSKAKPFWQATKPTWTGPAGSAIWFKTTAGNMAHEWNGTDFVPRPLGNGAIAPQSLIASDLFVTGSVSASLLEAVLVLASEIIVDQGNGEEVRISPGSGLVAYVDDDFDGVPQEVSRFGRNAGGRDPVTGRATWNVDNTGAAQYRTISSDEDIRVKGRLLLSEYIEQRPRGILFVSKDIQPLGTPASVETGMYEMAFTAEPGRAYRIHTNEVNIQHSVNGGRYAMMIHMTTDGGRPNHGSPMFAWHSGSCPIAAAPWESDSAEVKGVYINNSSNPVFVQMLLCMQPYGGGNINLYRVGNAGFFLSVEDLGLSQGTSQGVGMINNLTGTAPAPSAPAPREQTIEFLASWTRTWREDGGIQADGYAEQGYYPGKGNTRAMIGFPDMVGPLAGSSIRRIELYLNNTHWYRDSGGTAIIRTHGWGSVPNSFSQNTFPLGMDVAGWPKYQDWWMRCPADWDAGLLNGSIRGVTLGPAPSNSDLYYGRFDGSGSPFNKPTIRVVFVR